MFGDFIDRIYPIELEIKETTYTDRSASYLDLHLGIDSVRRNITTNKMISIFPEAFQKHLHTKYISHSWYDIPELVVAIRISLIDDCCNQGSYWTKRSYSLSWSHHFDSFTIGTMTWLIVMKYMCHKWPRICSTCRKHFLILSSFMTYHRVRN